MQTRTRFWLPVTLVVLVLGLAACGGDDEEEAAAEEPATTDEADDDAEAVADGDDAVLKRPIGFELAPIGDSGVTGMVQFTAATDGETGVEIILDSAGSGAPHPAHIHAGTCADLGDIVYPLEPVTEGTSSTTVDVSALELLEGEFAVNVHESEEEVGTYIACGEVPAADEVDLAVRDDAPPAEEPVIEDPVEVALDSVVELPDASGTATLEATGTETEGAEVRIELEGADESISHPAHLHLGTCDELVDEGQPWIALEDVEGGSSTTTLEATSMVELLDGNFSIDVHESEQGLEISIVCGEIPGINEVEA